MLGCSTAVTSGLLDLVWVAAWSRDRDEEAELWGRDMVLGRRGRKCGSEAESSRSENHCAMPRAGVS